MELKRTHLPPCRQDDTLDVDGNVALKTAGGDLLLCKPVVYQGAGDSKKIIAANYTISGKTVRFKLGKYDRNQPLVIDPKFDYVTYLGALALTRSDLTTHPIKASAQMSPFCPTLWRSTHPAILTL
jgi:hypothetical protein